MEDIHRAMPQVRKKDPIKWRVLSVDGNDAFLIADCNLDCQQYNTTDRSVTWENSTIRSWLNGYNKDYNANRIDYGSDNFIDKAFTSVEKEEINWVMVVNNDTKDKVFLLSIEEVTNQDYGFSSDSDEYDNARCKKTTTYAEAKGAYADSYMEEYEYNKNGFWWLRSPDHDTYGAALVTYCGCVSKSGISVANIDCAVCPALHLNLSSDVWSYAGTVCTDGTVDETPIAKARADE